MELEQTLSAGALRTQVTLPAGLPVRRTARLDLPVQAGDTVGRWTLLRPICQGAQSLLFLAGPSPQQADTVVKIYAPDKTPDAAALKRLRTIREPALLPLLDSGSHNGLAYEAMPLWRGNTLENVTLPEQTVIREVLPALDAALSSLHRVHLLHNDVKPANLFWREGQAVLGDYDCLSTETGGHTVGGTLAYMAPETLFSRGATRSPASDYCSMGLTLLALLTGASPLAGKSEEEAAAMWQRGIPCPEGISPRLAMLLRSLLRFDPAERAGHTAVHRWLRANGVAVQSAAPAARAAAPAAPQLRPLQFGDTVVLDIAELVQAAGQNWEYACFMLRQRQMDHFLIQFDPAYYDLCKRCAQMFDPDEALFVLMQTVQPEQSFYWCGGHYKDLGDFAEKALAMGPPKRDDPAVHFCRSGMLEFYFEKNGYLPEQIERARVLHRLAENDPELALTQILLAMGSHPDFSWHGQTFYRLEDLARWLLQQQDWDACVRELYGSKRFEAWMDYIREGTFLPEIRNKQKEVML